VTGILQSSPRTLQKEALLRIREFCLTWTETEEPCVEEINVR
jgi:hypothetical protein